MCRTIYVLWTCQHTTFLVKYKCAAAVTLGHSDYTLTVQIIDGTATCPACQIEAAQRDLDLARQANRAQESREGGRRIREVFGMMEARDLVYYGPGPGGGMVTVSANERREDERREEENGIEGSMAGDEDEDEIQWGF